MIRGLLVIGDHKDTTLVAELILMRPFLNDPP